MAKKIGRRTIVVVRAIKRDDLDLTVDGAPDEHEIKGCAILPRSSNEDGKGWVIVEGKMVIAPYGADVLATDLVKVDGETWEVEGFPGDYENKKAIGKATIIYLTRVGSGKA